MNPQPDVTAAAAALLEETDYEPGPVTSAANDLAANGASPEPEDFSLRGDKRLVKRIYRVPLDQDLVEHHGFKAARLLKDLECWLAGRVRRNSKIRQFTYDPVWAIAERTGLSVVTINRLAEALEEAGVLVIDHGRNNMRCYGFRDQNSYYESRKTVKRVWALQSDILDLGEPAAIILNNLRYWMRQNREQFRLHAGRYWRDDSLRSMEIVYAGFLSSDQIQRAMKLLVDRARVLRLDYYDQNGAFQHGRFWATLAATPLVSEINPENRVRWDGLQLKDGTVVSKQPIPPQNEKTVPQNDQTSPQNERTAKTKNCAQSIQVEAPGSIVRVALNGSHLTASALAGARSNAGKNILKRSLAEPAPERPPASKPPAATSSVAAPQTSWFENAFNKSAEPASQRDTSFRLGQVNQHQEESMDEKPNWDDMRKQGFRPSSAGFVNTKNRPKDEPKVKCTSASIPGKYRSCDLQLIRSEIREGEEKLKDDKIQTSNAELLQAEIEDAKMTKMKGCHAVRFSAEDLNCRKCNWSRSCQEVARFNGHSVAKKPKKLKNNQMSQDMANDSRHNARMTYQTCYRLVFGTEAPDALGNADAVASAAKRLKIPVHLFITTYMHVWQQSHPGCRFYSKSLTGDSAFKHVKVLRDASCEKFAHVSEYTIADRLRLPMSKGEADWRYRPGPIDEIINQFCAAWNAKFGSAYKVTLTDSRKLHDAACDLSAPERQRLRTQLVNVVGQCGIKGLAEAIKVVQEFSESGQDAAWQVPRSVLENIRHRLDSGAAINEATEAQAPNIS